MKPSKPNKSLILNALFVLGQCQPHDIKKWLDGNANRPFDLTVLPVDYYNTRTGDDLGYEVIGNKPSNISHVDNTNSPKQTKPKNMTWRTVMRNLKTLVEQEGVVKHDPKAGTYWLSADIRNEIRYFGTWFGEAAISRLFSNVTDMTDFINRIGAYIVWVFIEAMSPSSTKKAKDKDMLVEEWVESAIPIKSIFWRFVQSFKGLEVVRPENKGKPAYEIDITKINELESAVKKLYPGIYKSLLDTKEYMGIDRNKRTLTRKRPSRV